jgi:hypothetical protein
MELHLMTSPTAYLIWLAIITIDSALLYRFFTMAKQHGGPAPTRAPT